MTGEHTHTTSKQRSGTPCPNYYLKSEFPKYFIASPLHSSTNLKRTSAIKVATMKIMDDFQEAIACLP